MCNNMYMREKALEELQRERTREIENRRNIALATGNHNALRHIVKCCGTFLVMLGTRLEQAERRDIPARV